MFPSILKVSPYLPKQKNKTERKPPQLQDHQQVTENGGKTVGIPKYSKPVSNTPEKKNPRENNYFYTSKD